MLPLDVLDLPQLYTKPSAKVLLETLALFTLKPPSWDYIDELDSSTQAQSHESPRDTVWVNSEGISRYLISIVSSSLQWIEDVAIREEIWSQASLHLSDRSGRTAMGAMSRAFRITTRNGTVELQIHEPGLTGDDLGHKTWAASYLLAKRLHTFDFLRVGQEVPRVLELGSGTGLVGLAMAALGANVLLTDLPSIHGNLAYNVQKNSEAVHKNGGSLRTGILDWKDPLACSVASEPESAFESVHEPIDHKFSVILAADSLYSTEHPRLLVDAIKAWLSDDDNARVIVEFPYREAYMPQIDDFRARMARMGLHIVAQGEEKGYDDWGQADRNGGDMDMLVTCWWSCWGKSVIMPEHG